MRASLCESFDSFCSLFDTVTKIVLKGITGFPYTRQLVLDYPQNRGGVATAGTVKSLRKRLNHHENT